jgi:signal peptidase I
MAGDCAYSAFSPFERAGSGGVESHVNVRTLQARARSWWRKEIRPLLILALVIFSIRSSLADWNDVPTGSMKPTILEGDRVYVNRVAYDLKVPFTTWHLAKWSNPARGDIVVFYSPHDGTRLVKRVIGLPGDTVELRSDILFLNGKAMEYGPIDEGLLRDVAPADRRTQVYATEQLPGQPHAVAAIPRMPARRDFGPVLVPEGQYFMMGDNRDNSDDSRYWGFVPDDHIRGKAFFIWFNWDDISSLAFKRIGSSIR